MKCRNLFGILSTVDNTINMNQSCQVERGESETRFLLRNLEVNIFQHINYLHSTFIDNFAV